jgi:hypothetical protein
MKTISFKDDVLEWLIRALWEYGQVQRDLWRKEVENGKTPDECRYIKNEIFLCNAMLDDLKNVRNSGIDT